MQKADELFPDSGPKADELFPDKPQAAPDRVGRGRTTLDKGLQGATLGTSDEITNMLGSLIAHHVTGEDYHSLFNEATNNSKSRLEQERAQHPTLSIASEGLGALALPGAGEARLLSKVPEVAKIGKVANTAGKAALGGGVGGAVYGAGSADPEKRIEGAVRGAERGAATAGLLAGGLQGISKLVNPYIPKFDKAVKLLHDSGVKLTPGQASFNNAQFLKRAEDALGKLPIIGGKIKDQLTESFHSFNTAVLNKALSPIGKTMPKDVKPGRAAIAHAQEAISNEYDKLLPKLKFKVDEQFMADSKVLHDGVVSKLAEPQQKEFARIVNNATEDHIVPGQELNGKIYKKIESDVAHYQRRLNSKNAKPEDLELRDSLDSYLSMLRSNLARQNPAQRAELQKLNTSYAMFKRVQGASSRRVGTNGVFSPNDLLQKIKGSSADSEFARGDALLQDLADAGSQVLPKTIPDIEALKLSKWEDLVSGGAAAFPYAKYAGKIKTALDNNSSSLRRAVKQGQKADATSGRNAAIGSTAGTINGKSSLQPSFDDTLSKLTDQ